MRLIAVLFCASALSLFLPKQARAAKPQPSDMEAAHRWIAAHFGSSDVPSAKDGPRVELPFSFTFAEAPSRELLSRWTFNQTAQPVDTMRTQHTLVYGDPETKLEVRCVAIAYADFPAVEWTVYFRNGGSKDTPVLENVQAINVQLPFAPGDISLRYAGGSHESASDFAPQERKLDVPARFAPFGGRSSDGVLPFFNLVKPDGTGVVVGVGWTGQWAASFSKADNSVAIQAGMELTHLRLHPGEEIRTPAILLLFWSGADPIQGNNLLRSLLLEHYTPKPGGKPVEPPIAASPHGTIGFTDTTEANMVAAINNIGTHGFPVDTWWIDAGWHGENKDWSQAVGTWTANPQRYPNGLKPVADAAHAGGLRFLLWAEPERVMSGTWLQQNHREWLLTPANLPPELQYQSAQFHLLNFGNPDALAWVKGTFSRLIGDTGIDIYRQDFNMTPLYYWRNGEAFDRQGMNEIRYITGLYDFYDTLLREHPGLLIDTCASGGRRIDFEMLRRSLCLWRSDCCWEPIGTQGMTYGLSLWTPITGVGAVKTDPYSFRSGMGSHMSLALNYFNQPDMWEPTAAMIRQYQSIRRLFSADFYPLTPYSLDKNKWIAWQYHSADSGEGLVQAFRRDACPDNSITVKLRGLLPEARYTVTDLDAEATGEISGRELSEQGLKARVATAPGAALLHYTTVK